MRQTLFLTLPTAILIGLSRVYLGHHFPFDVLGGFFFGSILGIVLAIISGRITKNYGRRL
jgi:undecaprenyl-diphosphatase